MNAVLQSVIRQSGTAAFLCIGFALLQSFRVGEGLWRGAGLHGYVFEPGKAHNGQIVSIWDSFLHILIALSLAGLLGLIALRNGGVHLEGSKSVNPSGSRNTSRSKRKRRRH